MLHFADYVDPVAPYIGGNSSQTIKDYIESFAIRNRPKKCKKLLPLIHRNQYSPFYDKLLEFAPDAISRALQLGGCSPDSSDYPAKIGTELHKLVSKLIKC